MERKFKGIWIPAEIWLNKDLSALDRVLLAEIDSLDNDNHCTASNEYFAEFCGVGVATITRSIKKLKELGFIETEMIKSQTGSYRLIKMITPSNQNDEGGGIKMINNYNNNNNINNNTVISKDITEQSSDNSSSEVSLEFGKSKPKKLNLYQQCLAIINDYTEDTNIRKMLIDYLDLLLEKMRNEHKVLYANQFKGMLKHLSDLVASKSGKLEDIISQSISKGYVGFFPAIQGTSYSGGKKVTYRLPEQKIAKDEDKARDENGNYMVF